MAALEVVHQTWFGSNEEYVSGINMLPFTPISENLLPYDFMAQLLPLMKTALDRYMFYLRVHDAPMHVCIHLLCACTFFSLFCYSIIYLNFFHLSSCQGG